MISAEHYERDLNHHEAEHPEPDESQRDSLDRRRVPRDTDFVRLTRKVSWSKAENMNVAMEAIILDL